MRECRQAVLAARALLHVALANYWQVFEARREVTQRAVLLLFSNVILLTATVCIVQKAGLSPILCAALVTELTSLVIAAAALAPLSFDFVDVSEAAKQLEELSRRLDTVDKKVLYVVLLLDKCCRERMKHISIKTWLCTAALATTVVAATLLALSCMW